jgi:uncharacterized membrane protein
MRGGANEENETQMNADERRSDANKNKSAFICVHLRPIPFALALLSAGGAALAAAAPFLHSPLIDALFRPLCHQQPGRSFWIAGAPMAVCARCLGVYIGAAVGLFVSAFRLSALASGTRPETWHLKPAICLASLALLAADVLSEWLGLRPAWAAGRMLTGLLAGAAAAPLLADALDRWLLDPLSYNRGRAFMPEEYDHG